MAGSQAESYILRISSEGIERQLYGQRKLYVNIRRNWLSDTILLFIRNRTFIGSGIIAKFVPVRDLQEDEKKLCITNNSYGKIDFAKLVRFYPAIAVENTSIADQNTLGLHGTSLLLSDALQIEHLASARLVI
jgi:hypothetical protein